MCHVYVLVHMLRQENANLRTTNELLRRSHETARRYGCIGWMDMQDGRYTTTSVRYIYVTTPVDLSGAAREPSATSQAGGAGGRVQLGRRGQSVASPGGQEEAGRRAHVEASRNKKNVVIGLRRSVTRGTVLPKFQALFMTCSSITHVTRRKG